MAILGVGVDILHVPRITALLQRRRSRLPARILSSAEASQFNTLPTHNQALFLAVRWAVKEAAYKAIYPRARPTWKELTYHRPHEGAPTLKYQTSNDIGPIHVSVSHDGEYVFTTVIIETRSNAS